MPATCDVAVVGAGPAGSSAAYFLARQGLKVLLVDRFEFPRDKTCGDGLTPRALAMLDQMGLLETVHTVGFPTRGMVIQAPNGSTLSAPIPTIAGRFGYTLIVPRLQLDALLLEHALRAGASFQKMRVQTVEQVPRGVLIRGDGGAAVSAAAAVIAVGANVGLLLRMGVLARQPAMMVAARTYFEGLTGLTGHSRFYFSDVPLPGYGWLFPLNGDRANIGAGFFAHGPQAQSMPKTPAQALNGLLKSPALQPLVAQARQIGPVKGHPLRVDFATAPTVFGRILLAGEAAGLVNPLSGEGIDYALESGQMAAMHLAEIFQQGDFSPARFSRYDAALRRRFQALFVFCNRVRDSALTPRRLNLLVALARKRPSLQKMLLDIVLGEEDALQRVSKWAVLRELVWPRG